MEETDKRDGGYSESVLPDIDNNKRGPEESKNSEAVN